MLIVVSPAKKLDMKPVQGISETEPIFSNNAKELVDITKTLSVDDLKN